MPTVTALEVLANRNVNEESESDGARAGWKHGPAIHSDGDPQSPRLGCKTGLSGTYIHKINEVYFITDSHIILIKTERKAPNSSVNEAGWKHGPHIRDEDGLQFSRLSCKTGPRRSPMLNQLKRQATGLKNGSHNGKRFKKPEYKAVTRQRTALRRLTKEADRAATKRRTTAHSRRPPITPMSDKGSHPNNLSHHRADWAGKGRQTPATQKWRQAAPKSGGQDITRNIDIFKGFGHRSILSFLRQQKVTCVQDTKNTSGNETVRFNLFIMSPPAPGTKEFKEAQKKREKNRKRNEQKKTRKVEGMRFPHCLTVRAGAREPREEEPEVIPITFAEWKGLLHEISAEIIRMIRKSLDSGYDPSDLILMDFMFVDDPKTVKKGEKVGQKPPETRFGHGNLLFMSKMACEMYDEALSKVTFVREGRKFHPRTDAPPQDVRAKYYLRLNEAWIPSLLAENNLVWLIKLNNKDYPEISGLEISSTFKVDFPVDEHVIVLYANKAWEQALDKAHQKVTLPFGIYKLFKKCKGRPQTVQDELANPGTPADDGGDQEMEVHEPSIFTKKTTAALPKAGPSGTAKTTFTTSAAAAAKNRHKQQK